jgi:AP-3 complex subunit delta-1
VRESAVAILKPLLLDPTLLENTPTNATVPEALKAIAWIIGEYSHFVTDHKEVIGALMHPSVSNLPPHVQAVYVQATLKVYASAVAAHAGQFRPAPPMPAPVLAPFEQVPVRASAPPALAAPPPPVAVAEEEEEEEEEKTRARRG